MEFLQACLAAAIAENIVYLRGFPLGFPEPQRSFRNAFFRGLTAALCCLVAAAAGWMAQEVCLSLGFPERWYRPAVAMVFYLLFCAIYGAALWIFQIHGGAVLSLRDTLNFMAMGTMLLTALQCNSREKAMMMGVSCALGCLLANLLNYGFEQRLQESLLPRSMKGLPVMLLVYGMVSLALLGLTGRPVAM